MTPPPGRTAVTREALLTCLARLQLINHANWCYINASFVTMLWALLSTDAFSIQHWGPRASQLVDLLLTHNAEPVDLHTIPCLNDVITSWQGADQQGDPVEFLAHMMQGLQISGIDMRWEKRIQIGVMTETLDSSDAYTPLLLQFDPVLLQDDSTTLRQLIRDWSSQNGMQLALLNPTSIIYVQIDRHVRSGAGQITKCDIPVNFHWGIEIPVYTGDTLDIHWKTYKVVAAIAHLGMDNSGHCRALLQVQMNAQAQPPHMFLLTDDWAAAVPIWKEPSWFTRNTTCFWLCDMDHLHPHVLENEAPITVPPPPAPVPRLGASELLSLFVAGTDDTATT